MYTKLCKNMVQERQKKASPAAKGHSAERNSSTSEREEDECKGRSNTPSSDRQR